MKKSVVFACIGALLLIGFLGCEKRSGDAVVIGKDYVAAVKKGEEIKDQRATNHDQWIVKARMRDKDERSKSAPIERNGRSCAKTIRSRLRIGRVITLDRLGRRDRLTRVLSRESRTCAARSAAGER
jgi:hypothetical protein